MSLLSWCTLTWSITIFVLFPVDADGLIVVSLVYIRIESIDSLAPGHGR